MGKRLTDVLVKSLNGELTDVDIEFELNPDFVEKMKKYHQETTESIQIIDGEFSEIDNDA